MYGCNVDGQGGFVLFYLHFILFLVLYTSQYMFVTLTDEIIYSKIFYKVYLGNTNRKLTQTYIKRQCDLVDYLAHLYGLLGLILNLCPHCVKPLTWLPSSQQKPFQKLLGELLKNPETIVPSDE